MLSWIAGINIGAMMRALPFLAFLLAAGYAWTLKTTNTSLKARLTVSEAALGACDARNDNISEDRTSDAEIDNTTIDRDSLRDAAERFLLPETGRSTD